jgi:RNA polymerase sigma factor (sigma-70 family)
MHHVSKRRTGGGPPHPPEAASSDPDGSLLVRARREPEVFGIFYDRNQRGVQRYFVRLTGSPDVAAELAAETFAQALASFRHYDPRRGSGATWLFGIATHQFHRFLRRGDVDRRYRTRMGMTTMAVWTADDLDRVVDLADAAARVAHLRVALDQLSDGVRAAVELRVGHELPYAEVAARLGCTEGSARVRVARGMRQLTIALVEP